MPRPPLMAIAAALSMICAGPAVAAGSTSPSGQQAVAVNAFGVATAATAEAPTVASGQLPPPDLPMPDPPSESIVGPTLATSVNRWTPKRRPLREDAPNILLIMNDDAGFGHPDTFGGPVHTPSLSRVAAAGVAYNRFHTTAICSPTRASLLTGRNHHFVGAGQITEFASAFPGYTGKIPRSAATVAKVLSGYGYDTAAFGKWHNTPVDNLFRTGPFDQYPTGLGFSYFYGFIGGETSQYEPRLFENTNPIEPPYTPEDGYHLTEDLAAQAVKFIRNNRALTPGRPFFIYFAPGGTHGPHHVRPEWADKYKGKFDQGWEELRATTFGRQRAMGWVPDDTELNPLEPLMVKWDQIPEEQKAFQLRLMEVYAGFLEHTDTQHSKILDELDRQNLTENTLVIYVFADNGASAEGYHGTLTELLAENALPSTVDQQIDVLNKKFGGAGALGSRHLDNMYHSSWAWAGDTPFKSTKLVASRFGGTRTPLVISWPKVIKPDKIPRSQFHHVCDIVPTIYEAVGIKPPGHVDGVTQDPVQGVSMVYTFNNATAEDRKTVQYFEVMGSRGVYKDGWFAGTFGPRTPWSNNNSLETWKPEEDVWELYNLTSDYSQARDLAADLPQKVAEMKAVFSMEAAQNKVMPIGAGLYTVYYHPEEAPHSDLKEFSLFPGQNRIAESNAPLFRSGFSSVSTIEAVLRERTSGVLFAVGGSSGGFAVFMDDGYLHAEYSATVVYQYSVRSSAPLPAGPATIEVHLVYDPGHAFIPSATLALRVNGTEVGRGRVEKSIRVAFSATESFDIGLDLGSAVSLQYEARLPFAFDGEIKSVRVKYLPPTDSSGAAAQAPDSLVV